MLLTRSADRHNFLENHRDISNIPLNSTDLSMRVENDEFFNQAAGEHHTMNNEFCTKDKQQPVMPNDNNDEQATDMECTKGISADHYASYIESTICEEPEADLIHLKDLNAPPPGNCLFNSLIVALGLNVSAVDLRATLLNSFNMIYCTNIKEARRILASESEYGTLDCVYVAARHFSTNICIHF